MVVAALVLVLAGVRPSLAQVSTRVGGVNLSLNSFLQADWAISTSDRSNQFNMHGLSTEHNAWNQMAYRGESFFSLELDQGLASDLGMDSFRMFVHPRLYADAAPQVDEYLHRVNLFGGRDGGRYPGNGWLASTTGTHEYVLDAQEAYADLRTGPLRMRIGKQQIAWGTALFLRSLDAVDSLDLRRHGIFDIIGNEYADSRIAEWTALATYDIPTFSSSIQDTSLSLFVSPDFQPFILPANGSAYNVLPSEVLLNDGRDIAQARRKLVYGGVAKASVFGVDLTANYVSTPNTLGIFKLAPATVGPLAGTPFIFDTPNGVNSLANFVHVAKTARLSVPALRQTLLNRFGGPVVNALLNDAQAARGFPLLDQTLQATPVDVVATRVFPRDEIFGASAAYYVQPVHEFPGAALLNGTLLKFEGTYTPNRAFTSPGLGEPLRSGELNAAFETEKQVRWNVNVPSAFVVLEYWFKSRSDFFNRWEPGQGESNFQLVGLAIQQGLYGNRIRVDSSLVMDVTNGPGVWWQPGIAYKPRDYLQWDLYYNYFQGGNKDIFGPLSGFDELFMKATYKF
jgi:hypothetical protein